MAAPINNQFWRLAENIGKPKSYQPEELWAKFIEFVEYYQSNPWHKKESVKGGSDSGRIISIPTERPLTIHGFCVFANIATQTFYNYDKTEEYLDITTRIKEICYTQKFEGAAVGAYNANIIARDLGLANKTEIENKGPAPVLNFTIEPPKEADE